VGGVNISEEVSDGRIASLKVKEYFEELHGTYGVLNFNVEDVEYDEKSKVWYVVCNFYPNLFAAYKLRYKVTIDNKGRIFNVQQLELKK